MEKAILFPYKKIKLFLSKHSLVITLFLTVVLLSLISFGLGYITATYQSKTPLRVVRDDTMGWQESYSAYYSLKG